MAAFLPVAVLLSLLVTCATADGYYNSQTTPSTSTPASYTPTPATSPPPPPTSHHATPPKPAHGYDNDDDEKKLLVVVLVEGLVLCQSCGKREAVPLRGAKVAVTCRDTKNSVVVAETGHDGYFHAEFSVGRADVFWTKDPRGACFVRLHSSPDPKCNVISDVHGGWHGAPRRDEGKHLIAGVRKIVHAAHPLAFRPAKCTPPHHH